MGPESSGDRLHAQAATGSGATSWSPEHGGVTRWLPVQGGAAVAESALRIGGLHCAACAPLLEQALRSVEGVLAVRVDGSSQRATLQWDPERVQAAQWLQAIAAAGYSAVPDTAAEARELRRSQSRAALWRLFVAAMCSMQVMMMAAPAYFSDASDLPPDLKRLLDGASWILTLPVILFSAHPFFQGAWRALRQRRIGMDLPVSLGILVAFLASSAAAFDPGGPLGSEVYFDSLTMFVSFLLGGRYLELKARQRAEEALEESSESLPASVRRVGADGQVESVATGSLRKGDVVRVPVGQLFAVDGRVLRGSTEVDEALLSGESRPLAKQPGDSVVAGSLNLRAPVDVQVEALGADTRREQIMALTREAQANRAMSAPQWADRWAAPFLWSVLVLAGLGAAAWSLIDPSRAIWVAVSVLIVTCPCALSLAVPSALLAAAGNLSRHGLLLRKLGAIEGLVQMRRLFLDKTGTLTRPSQGFQHMRPMPQVPRDLSDADLIRLAAALAAWSDHPAARALSSAQGQCPAADGWRQIEEVLAKGVQGVDEAGQVWRLGEALWVGASPSQIAAWPDAVLWLGRCHDEVLACFEWQECLREDALPTLQALQQDGVQLSLLSGDHPLRVARLAHQAGLADFQGDLQPQDKLARLTQAQVNGERCAMLGDGVNDAPVLAQADLSIAMGEGSWAARAQADAVLVSSRLADLLHARRVARLAQRVVRQNLAWAALYNLACVPMALMAWLPPWAAGLGMASSSLLVVLNSMRLARAV